MARSAGLGETFTTLKAVSEGLLVFVPQSPGSRRHFHVELGLSQS
jgi:hypothetical protein